MILPCRSMRNPTVFADYWSIVRKHSSLERRSAPAPARHYILPLQHARGSLLPHTGRVFVAKAILYRQARRTECRQHTAENDDFQKLSSPTPCPSWVGSGQQEESG